MKPVKEILQQRHVTPRPPILVVDESSIKSWNDAGPVCGCDEKYELVKRYKPFFPGTVNPYKRREIPDTESLQIFWKKLKVGEEQYRFEKPIAIHPGDIRPNFKFPKQPENVMLLRQQRYTDSYIKEKLRECQREHAENCTCPEK